MSAGVCLICFLVIFLLCAIAFRVPVAYSLGISSLAMLALTGLPLIGYSQVLFSSIDNFPMLAIGFFIYAGSLMEYSGISAGLLRWVETFVGRMRGNTAAVTVVASGVFGMLTGSGMSTLSAIGKPMISEMKKKGYAGSYAAAVAAASCFLGILIPPSGPGISYALISGCKIMDVWLATLCPGILIILAYILLIYLQRRRVEPKCTDPKLPFGRFMGKVATNTRNATAALIMPIIIFGSIYGGVCTATEAGALSAVYGLGYFVIKRYVKKDPSITISLTGLSVESAKMIACIGLLQVFAYTCSRMISQVGISTMLANWVLEYIGSRNAFLLIVNVIFLFMGMFMDMNPAILLMTPLLLESAVALGIEPAHFGAIAMVNLCYGNLTPPFACACFVSSQMADAPFAKVIRDSLPFLAVGLVIIAVTTYCPKLIMWLPHTLNG